MDTNGFVHKLRKLMLDEDLTECFENLNIATLQKVTDTRWKNAISLYQSLQDDQKRAFEAFVRLTYVNNISTILGIIDGVVSLDGKTGEFQLNLVDSESVVNLTGDLQESFLIMEDELEDGE